MKLTYALLTLALLPVSLAAQQSTPPDNSKANIAQKETADAQGNTTADRNTAARVRRSIIADKSLSMYGHNVKVIVADGNLTLAGPVHSEAEKKKVAADAEMVVNPTQITNNITVK